MKKQNYISWDDFFIGVAELASKRSKDPSTSHGACIIDPITKKILSVGYNGLPRGLSDDTILPGNVSIWAKTHKYSFVVHAEQNAIFNASVDLTGSTLYLYSEKGYYPCTECAKAIVQNGIEEVVLQTAIKNNTDVYNFEDTKFIFTAGDVKIRVLNKE